MNGEHRFLGKVDVIEGGVIKTNLRCSNRQIAQADSVHWGVINTNLRRSRNLLIKILSPHGGALQSIMIKTGYKNTSLQNIRTVVNKAFGMLGIKNKRYVLTNH